MAVLRFEPTFYSSAWLIFCAILLIHHSTQMKQEVGDVGRTVGVHDVDVSAEKQNKNDRIISKPQIWRDGLHN